MGLDTDFTPEEDDELRRLLAKRIAWIAVHTGLSPANIEALAINLLGLGREESAELATIASKTYSDRLDRTTKVFNLSPPRRLTALGTGLTQQNYKQFYGMIKSFILTMKETQLQQH